ncbi:hypothetical protein DFJ73DRAFT_813824 [Zopfochytrium polystomum]|nr:hypothetical protein DFJ73DRAFT_813824 [Zopfochytrium polystomum]
MSHLSRLFRVAGTAATAIRAKTSGRTPNETLSLLARGLSTVHAEGTPGADVFDVCIVGAGIVGTALASSLARLPAASSLRIALIESGDLFSKPTQSGEYSNRVSSITPESARFLQSIGAWEKIDDVRKRAYTRMEVRDAVGPGFLEFTSGLSQSSPDAIAWIVENAWLRYSLVETVKNEPNISIFNGARVTAIEHDVRLESDWPRIYLAEGKVVQARLLVGADGGNSLVRANAGIDSWGWDYQQNGLVATLKIDPETAYGNRQACQRFLPTGPIALLPLADDVSSLVWSTTPAIAKKLSCLSSEDFVTFVNVALRNPLPDLDFLLGQIQLSDDGRKATVAVDAAEEGRWGLDRHYKAAQSLDGGASRLPSTGTVAVVTDVVDGSRASFPLRFRKASHYVKTRVALIGDAAHTIHPLAGQGLNLGFGDAEELSKVIDQGVVDGQDFGQVHILEGYSASRYVNNLGMMAAVDGIGRIFGSDLRPLSFTRSAGMNIIQQLPWIKTLAMKAASS